MLVGKDMRIAIMMGITKDWAFAAATVLLALKKTCTVDYEVIIQHNGLSSKDMKVLNSICTCTFNEYNKAIGDKFKRVTNMAFSRFEVFKLIAHYDRILWIDADTLVLKDISPLFNIETQGIAMFKHKNTPMLNSFSKAVPGYDMKKECYNTGVLMVSNKLPFGVYDWCYKKVSEWYDSINSEQAIINAMLQRFNITPTTLNINYNCHPNRKTKSTVILHPWGLRKFWKGHPNEKWDELYKEWLKLKEEEEDSR